MEIKIRKDDIGYNWLLSTDGLVLAFGAQKSFPTHEGAHEAFKMITRDLLEGIMPTFDTRRQIGLFCVTTPESSPIRFATLHESEHAARQQAIKILNFIEVC